MEARISGRNFRKLGVLPACAAAFEDTHGFTGVRLDFGERTLTGWATNGVLLAMRQVRIIDCDVPETTIWVKATDLSRAARRLSGDMISVGIDGTDLSLVAGETALTMKILIPAMFDFQAVLDYWNKGYWSGDAVHCTVSRTDFIRFARGQGTDRVSMVIDHETITLPTGDADADHTYLVNRRLLLGVLRSITERELAIDAAGPQKAVRISAKGLAVLIMPMKNGGGAR